MALMRVGFVGLGNMGLRMAANLLKHGHQVVVNDVRGDVMTALEAQGASVARSPGELSGMLAAGRRGAAGAGALDVVMTMLPSSASVEEVYCGSEGLLTHLPAGAGPAGAPEMLMIDASTISPAVSTAVAAEGLRRGVRVLDAPVSGGVVGAAAGTLTFMVGGERTSYLRAEPLLAVMGKKSVHCGEAGSGQAVKLCNNLALAIQMASIAESMALGQKLGLDLKVLSDVMNMSSARCWSRCAPEAGGTRSVAASGRDGGRTRPPRRPRARRPRPRAPRRAMARALGGD